MKTTTNRHLVRILGRRFLLAGSSLVFLGVGWKFLAMFSGTEAEGGKVTGPLGDLYNVGFLVLVIALLLTLFFPRIAGAATIAACLLCLPLVLYLIVPTFFRRVLGGFWETQPSYYWAGHAIVAAVALATAMCIGLWNLVAPIHQQTPREPCA